MTHLLGLQKDPNVCEKDNTSHHSKEEHVHNHLKDSLDGQVIENHAFTDNRGSEDIPVHTGAHQYEIHCRREAANDPQTQSNQPNSFRSPGDGLPQRVEDSHVALQ